MEQKRIFLSAGIAGLLVIIVYVWFINIGPWRIRGYTSDYYSQLASAFQQRQLALDAKPDPALLALPNPYDHKARKDVPVLGDASLYKGKYYLYFGPLPSLVLAGVTYIIPMRPGDQIFVYLFVIGIFVIQSLLLIAIFRRYFANLPGWIIPMGILLFGLTGPFTRMLAHPYIHEAAISAGQFFSTAGLFFAYLALQEKPFNNRNLLVASALWACSISTRITQLIPVGSMAVITLLFIIRESRRAKSRQDLYRASISLIAPLAICGLVLAWYNWARFDSVFEFGLYYQLAAFNLQANYSALFSRVYVVQNIYNYFLNPFALTHSFPFAFPLAGSEKSVWASHELPRLYAVEGKFAGALLSTPFLIFSLLPVVILIVKLVKSIRSSDIRNDLINHFDWTISCLLASFIAGSIPTLLIFYVGFRYETEFITSLTMLALIGFCQGYLLFKRTVTRVTYSLFGAILMVFSVLANIALAITGVTS